MVSNITISLALMGAGCCYVVILWGMHVVYFPSNNSNTTSTAQLISDFDFGYPKEAQGAPAAASHTTRERRQQLRDKKQKRDDRLQRREHNWRKRQEAAASSTMTTTAQYTQTWQNHVHPSIAWDTITDNITTPQHSHNFSGLPSALHVTTSWVDRLGNFSGPDRHDLAGASCCSHWGQRRNRRKARKGAPICTGVCFTPQACVESNSNSNSSIDPAQQIYPFRSVQERQEYWPIEGSFFDNVKTWIQLTKTECMTPAQPQPSHHWNTSLAFPFQHVKDNGNDTAATAANNNNINTNNNNNTNGSGNTDGYIPPPGCSDYTGGGGNGPYANMYIIPEAKLVFCGIPKVGITNWLQFIRYVMGAHDYPSFPHGKPDLKAWKFDTLHPQKQQEIWNSQKKNNNTGNNTTAWTFAVFLRDPVERLLSAYLDKLSIGQRKIGVEAKRMGFTRETFSFETFIEYLSKDIIVSSSSSSRNPTVNCSASESLPGLSWCTDPHWRPQSFSCGMSEQLSRFDFIGTLDNLEEQSRELLQRVNLWNDYGQHYRNGQSTRTSKINPCVSLFPLDDELPHGPDASHHLGFQQSVPHHESAITTPIETTKNEEDLPQNGTRRRTGRSRTTQNLSWNTIGHATSANDKTHQYYTPELIRQVQDVLYKYDYQLWTALHNHTNSQSGTQSWVSGADLVPALVRLKEQEKEQ